MRFSLVLIFLISISFGVFAQGKGNSGNNANPKHNYMEVNTNTTLNFVCDGPEDLENDIILSNAITLNLRTKNSDSRVYVKLQSYNAPGGNTGNCPLKIDWTSDNSNNVQSLVRDPLQLTNMDQMLFAQPQRSNPLSFQYDLILSALGYDYPAGQYSFTILFTMTQP